MELLEPVPTVDEMTIYTLKHLMTNFGFKTKEIGPYRGDIRFDVLGIKRYSREIRIFEVKSCRQDFTSDKKWQKYLPYCTHFAFVAPKGVIKPEEIPKGIGLVEFWHEESKWSRDDGKWYLQHDYVRGCKRLQERPDDEHYIALLEGIIMRLMSQCDEYKHYWDIKAKMDVIESSISEVLYKVKGLPGVAS